MVLWSPEFSFTTMASAFSTCITWGGRERSGERRPYRHHDPKQHQHGAPTQPTPAPGAAIQHGRSSSEPCLGSQGSPGQKQLTSAPTILLSKPSTTQNPTVFPSDATAHSTLIYHGQLPR